MSHSTRSPPPATLTGAQPRRCPRRCPAQGAGHGKGRGSGGFSGTQRQSPAKGLAGCLGLETTAFLSRPHVTHSNLSLHKAEAWRHRVPGSRTGRAKPTRGPSDPEASDLRFPHGSFRVVSAPGRPAFPESLPPAEASRGREAAARPVPVPSVPTSSALSVRGRGPGWAAWPALESAAPARSPRPGPARGRAAACRHPGQGPNPARAHPPAPPRRRWAGRLWS